MRFQFVQLSLIFNPLGRYPRPPRLKSSQADLPPVLAQVRVFLQPHAHISVMVDKALAVGADVPLLLWFRFSGSAAATAASAAAIPSASATSSAPSGACKLLDLG